jgi:uncharacterized ion transporter superfamily protein YfcC
MSGTEATAAKKFKVPHTLVIIILFILFAVFLTWVIPAGEFDRVTNAAGIKVIDPASFRIIPSKPVSLFRIPDFIVDGFAKSASLFFLLLFTGGAFDVVVSSGAIQSCIAKVAKRYASKESIFIPILTLLFALIATTQGVNTFIGFAPVMVLIARAMGFDSIVGAAVILLGGAVGFSTGTLNPNTTIVAQEIVGLPLYSGIGYRWICFLVFLVVTNLYLIRYAKKIRLHPELSPMYDLDIADTSVSDNHLDSFGSMTLRKSLVLASLVAALGVIVYGGVKLDWGLNESSAAFIWLGIIAGICAGFSPSKIASCFVAGAKRMVAAALIIGLARAVSGVLSAGLVLDTVVNSLGRALLAVPTFLQAISMYIANLVVNIFITSGSGQAAVVMPIFAPIADMVGITRQTAILTFNFGDGFCNYILPTSTALMGILGATNIPYDRWMRFMWRLFLIWVLLGSVLSLIAQIINLGPA